jgi:hypothetical protein
VCDTLEVKWRAAVIEIRSSYLVRLKDSAAAAELWRHGRDTVWPKLEWTGRIQSMLHGHAQQSLFVWSSQWENLTAWEAGMARTQDISEYREWSQRMNQLRIYGSEREIFSILGTASPLDNTSGRVEIRSAYLVQMHDVQRAREHLQSMQVRVWPDMKWGGQIQQMLHGKASQSLFVWTSVWDNLADWEQAMVNTRSSKAFQDWWTDWKEIVDFGSTREIFRNL